MEKKLTEPQESHEPEQNQLTEINKQPTLANSHPKSTKMIQAAVYRTTRLYPNANLLDKTLLHRISIAPMMEYTNTHFRFFIRLLSRNCTLWTEMLHCGALAHNESLAKKELTFNKIEHPVICQVGGSDIPQLQKAAIRAEQAGFDEINLNCGCPSPRVTAGSFGCCLMKTPEDVSSYIRAMKEVVSIPVHVKCRIGVDNIDDYDSLKRFIEEVRDNADCTQFVIHARKAFLKGLNPAQNRSIPPLKYDFVTNIAKEYPELNIEINGGFRTLEDIEQILVPENNLRGCMVGRLAFQNPWVLSDVDRRFYGVENVGLSRKEILRIWGEYGDLALSEDSYLTWTKLVKPIIFLFKDESFSGRFRRFIANLDNRKKFEAFSEFIQAASDMFEECNPEAINRLPP